MFVVDSETNIMNTKTNHQITSSKSSPGAPETLNRNADSPASGPRSGLRARLRSLGLGLLGAVLLLPLPGARAFTLIDSGTQMPAFCSAAGQAADIITNPNDRWWWGMPPNPPGPVVIRYRYTAAFDTAFANTTAHPNLNSAIKQQIDLAFQTWVIGNMATVQFDHRLIAWALSILIPVLWWRMSRAAISPAARLASHLLLAALVIQFTLGVATLLLVVPVALGAAHQGGALVLFAAALAVAHELS